MEFIPEQFAEPGVRYTPRKTVLKGVFELSKVSVPFFLANMSLEDIQRELKLVEEMPADYRAKWRIEELFQRDIDWDRVNDEIVNGYLKRKEKRTFFNALTVALLPIKKDGILDDQYGMPEELPPDEPPFGHTEYMTQNIGGVQIATRKKAETDLAYLRWNEHSIFAATIDGQHRLAALKTFADSTVLTRAQRATKVPVIFLILDEKTGFHTDSVVQHGDANPLLSMVREIFIDLNKHAKEVSIARQVLLDDQELEARCARSLIAERIGEDTGDEIPLGLVNWKDDVAKFDKGPYITSVYVLYLIVKDLLSIAYPKDPLEESEVRKFVASVEDRLSVSHMIRAATGPRAAEYKNKDDLIKYVEHHHFSDDESLPFRALPYAYGSAAVDYFESFYKPLIVGLFKHFEPYKRTWNKSHELGGIDGDLAFFNAQNKKAQKQLKEDVWSEGEFEEKVTKPEEELAALKVNEWAYMVVFQKAVIKATVDIYYQAPIILDDNPSIETFVMIWTDFLNSCHEKGLFSIDAPLRKGKEESNRLWEGVSQAPFTHSIKYTNAAVGRIKDVLILFWYLHHSHMGSAEAFLKQLEEPDSNQRYPDGLKCAVRVRNALRSVVKARHSAKLEDLSEDDAKVQIDELAWDRLVDMLDAAS